MAFGFRELGVGGGISKLISEILPEFQGKEGLGLEGGIGGLGCRRKGFKGFRRCRV